MPSTPAALCHHHFADGHRCGSPALRGEPHCYHHHPTRKPVDNPYARRARRGFHLNAPTSPATLQSALSEIITRLAANKLDVHRAGLLLYSLQIAGQHLTSQPHPAPNLESILTHPKPGRL